MKKNKTSIPEGLQKIAQKYRIPEIIPLRERTRQVETVLVLCGAVEGPNSGLRYPQFNYKIIAEFPYSLHGKEGDYSGVDFSGGPTLWKWNEITENLFLENIEPPMLTLEYREKDKR